jgi:hypothetical protein
MDLGCETCRKLWDEYGVAVRQARDARPLAGRAPEMILNEIKTHEKKAPLGFILRSVWSVGGR